MNWTFIHPGYFKVPYHTVSKSYLDIYICIKCRVKCQSFVWKALKSHTFLQWAPNKNNIKHNKPYEQNTVIEQDDLYNNAADNLASFFSLWLIKVAAN